MTGRPSKFSQAAVDEIIQRVSEGEPLARVCRDPHLPALSTFRDWVRKHDGLSVRLAGAREDMADVIAAEVLEIVDNGHNDPQLARVRAEMRLKLLAKWDQRYGDVTQIRHANHEGGNLRDISESEAAARVAAILEAARRRLAATIPEEGGESLGD